MKRRTLDIAFSVGGIIFSILLLVVGLILTNQKNFAETYVHDQLREQEISFKPAEKLASEEDFQALLNEALGSQEAVDAFVADKQLTSEANSGCLQKYAGQQMLTGKQAECYSEDFIRLHTLAASIVDGKSYTYATVGALVGAARTAVADATEAGEPAEAIAELQAKADKLQSLRFDTLLRGETLRGLLLTSYGFSVFGERAGQAALVTYLAALVLFILSIAGFVHAFTSKKADDVILAVDHHATTTT